MNKKLFQYLGLPALFLGAAVAVGSFMNSFGFVIKTPEQSLTEHVVESQAVHQELDQTIRETDQHLHLLESAAEALVVRICIRDGYQELMAQRMLKTCEDLGVPRVPGDMGAREAVEAGSPAAMPMAPARPDTTQ